MQIAKLKYHEYPKKIIIEIWKRDLTQVIEIGKRTVLPNSRNFEHDVTYLYMMSKNIKTYWSTKGNHATLRQSCSKSLLAFILMPLL